MKLCSVQPFSLAGAGGGPRILSSMLSDPPMEVLSVCTAPVHGGLLGEIEEAYVPSRPSFGRLESTRLNRYLGVAGLATRESFRRRLREVLRREDVSCVHAVAHDADFATAHTVARELGLPFFLSVHDDPYYTLGRRPGGAFALRGLGDAWRQARQRFVISPEMAAVMSERFGDRSYDLITDGLPEVQASPRTRFETGPLVAYFMGAFHMSYKRNLESFVAGAARWRERSGRDLRLIMRSGTLPEPADLHPDVEVEFRDWATHEEIAVDLEEVDLLYLPLPFGAEHEPFVRYSLSTKLVTYTGSGLPILYHGPREAAACDLLSEARAAAIVDSLDPDHVGVGIGTVAASGEELAKSALCLARERFDLDQLRNRFWSAIEGATSQADEALAAPISPGSGLL